MANRPPLTERTKKAAGEAAQAAMADPRVARGNTTIGERGERITRAVLAARYPEHEIIPGERLGLPQDTVA
jgi:hypothetical protein